MGLIRRILLEIWLHRARVIVETFVNRRDKLYKRVRTPLKCVSHEYFHPGRPAGLKEFLNIPGRRRVMRFYLDARLDGLLERVDVIGKGMTERFRGRDDNLRVRRVNVDRTRGSRGQYVSYLLPSAELGELAIVKMVERFDRARDGTPAEIDVATRTFFVADGRATYAFHYDSTQICKKRTTTKMSRRQMSTRHSSSTDPAAHRLRLRRSGLPRSCCRYATLRGNIGHTSVPAQRGRGCWTTACLKQHGAYAGRAAGRKEDKERFRLLLIKPRRISHTFPAGSSRSEHCCEQTSRSRTNCLAALKSVYSACRHHQKRLDGENQKLAKKQAAFSVPATTSRRGRGVRAVLQQGYVHDSDLRAETCAARGLGAAKVRRHGREAAKRPEVECPAQVAVVLFSCVCVRYKREKTQTKKR